MSAAKPTAREIESARVKQRNADIRESIIEAGCEAAGSDRTLVDKQAAVTAGRERMVLDGLQEILEGVFKKGYATPKPYKGKKTRYRKYITNVLLSDLHYRSVLDPREVPIAYDSPQEARRTGKVALQVADYKRHHRDKSKLIVHLIGDIIQGQLHDARDGDPLAMQFAGALHYLTQLIWYWASEYQEVEVKCVPGNHGRNMARHHNRAVHQKWDSIETMLYIALKQAVLQGKNTRNVKVNISMRPYYTYQAFDQKGFVTHGDTVLKVGYPGKVIRVGQLHEQIMKWNTAREIGGPFGLFAAGHVHVGSSTILPGNVTFISNGCLVPPDPFAVSIGSPDVTCGQWVWESVEGHIFGDSRFITVDDADGDPSYEEIITPFDPVL